MTRALGAILLLIVVAAAAGCSGGEEGRHFAGYVEAELVLVGPEESGRIASVEVAEGEEVAQGAVLFKLDSKVQDAALASAEAQLRQAAAALELSRATLERAQRLQKQGVAPKANLDDARAAFERDMAAVAAAEASVTQARTMLARRTVTAPVSGVVQDLYFRAGEVVSAGQPVVALLPPENLRVRFFIPEPRRAQIRLGDVLRVSCDNCPPDLQAKVSFIAREAEYTPPVIFSREERAKLVYLVEAVPLGETRALGVGQPVTVHIDSTPPIPRVAGR